MASNFLLHLNRERDGEYALGFKTAVNVATAEQHFYLVLPV
jgi:hypothetical protein